MKAKLLMTASLVVCFSSIILGQDSYRPYPGELGVALRARGIGPIRDNQFDGVFDLGLFDQPTLQVRYMKSDLWTFRFDLAIDGLSAKETTRDEEELSGGGVRVEETEITSSRFDFIFAPGIEYHFTGTDRLDPYFGMQVPFKLIGKLTETNSEKIDAGSDFKSSSMVTTVTPGGVGFGIDIFTGFNYFVTNRLALGLEYNLGVLSERVGGTYTTKVTTEVTSGGNTTMNEFEDSFEATATQTVSTNRGVLSFNIVYFFGDF